MSKQETLAWTSLGTSASVLVFYLLVVFGWPDALPDFSATIVKIFFNVFWVAVVVEIIVELNENRVDKDERDFIIEARGIQYAYNFLSVAVAVVLVNMFLSFLLGDFSEIHVMIGGSKGTFHSLFIVLVVSSLIKRTTQIYQYQKGESV